MLPAVAIRVTRFERKQVIAGELAVDALERLGIGADLPEHRAACGAGHARYAVLPHIEIARRRGRHALLRCFESWNLELQTVNRDAGCLRLGRKLRQIDTPWVDDHAFRDEDYGLRSRQILQTCD